jgi:cell division protein FtsQ
VRRATLAAAGAGLLAATVVLLWTPLLGVRSVAVSGTARSSAHAVRAAAKVAHGHPLLTLPVREIASRVASLPTVASADVRRDWPSTVRIEVTERSALAWRPEPDGAHLLDASGADFAAVASPPQGLPRLMVPPGRGAGPRERAALHALDSLRSRLQKRVVTVAADSPVDVRFGLADGKKVVWGAAKNARRKGAVLAVLLSRKGSNYDVAAPELPTVS